jgi:hypothetical protein
MTIMRRVSEPVRRRSANVLAAGLASEALGAAAVTGAACSFN